MQGQPAGTRVRTKNMTGIGEYHYKYAEKLSRNFGLSLPKYCIKRLKEMADKIGVLINQLITLAVIEKVIF